ncbi:hypothetical protein [Prosthecobacter sp.]|uniref:hypothetical protein n=1 Tax=Prosthecobacter sp. TaxID=1965333 RepID=UPI003783586B
MSAFKDASSDSVSRPEVGEVTGFGLCEGVETITLLLLETGLNASMLFTEACDGGLTRGQFRNIRLARQCHDANNMAAACHDMTGKTGKSTALSEGIIKEKVALSWLHRADEWHGFKNTVKT